MLSYLILFILALLKTISHFKDVLMQIWKSANIFVFVWK